MISQAVQHNVSYFKRFRMEIDLQERLAPVPALPPGYTWVAWENWLLEQHAEVKYQCFIEEIDAVWGGIMTAMSTGVRFTALYAAQLVASLTEIRDVISDQDEIILNLRRAAPERT